ncbi:MAG: peptidyl-prolyl cis-trans isomerase, partial [Candidatus Dependentiae bacterium]|nr:peptidyl-prolyl cis-trans isomerase [Candidatus Dependentiae bacterium]
NVSNSGTTGNLGTAGNSGKGEVLLTIDGKPVLYSDDYEDQKLMAQQSNQQLNMILQMIPDAEFNMLFKSIEAGHLMKEWVLRSGIDQKPELIKQRRQYHEAIDLQLYMKYYEDAHPIHVSNEEAEAYYNAKRDQMPGLILSPASVDIVYAKFTTKAAAENFAGKVRDGSEKHFKLASKEADVKTENMVVKSDDANVSESLKNSVLAATKFPSKEIVKIDDNSYWVVGMLRKKDVEYRSFETPEVKQGITKMCRDEKREVELTKQIEQLNSQYNVVENKSYFENKKQNQANALKKAEQIVLQAQQQNTNDAALDMTDNKI